MRIISPFKDYYDYISHQYGEDPQCVYVRRPLPSSKLLLTHEDVPKNVRALVTLPMLQRSGPAEQPEKFEDQIFWQTQVIVAGRYVFPMLVSVQHGKPVHYEVLTSEHADLFHRPFWPMGPVEIPQQMPNEQALFQLTKLVEAPVYTVLQTWRGLELEERVPILRETPIPALVPATEMWQSIFHVLTNVLRLSPDKEPPKTVNNEERIQAAGFDLKTSFRHPIKWKKER